MKVLGLDTSSAVLALGIIEEDKILADVKVKLEGNLSEVLWDVLNQTLRDLSLELKELSALAYSIGPGSFTGLRVGLAFIKGLSFSTGIPIVPVPTLDALASQVNLVKTLVVPLIDAKKDLVYSALYTNNKGTFQKISDYMLLPLDKMVEKIPQQALFILLEDENFRAKWNDLTAEKNILAKVITVLPSGVAVAKLGFEKFEKNQVADLSNLEPLYVSPLAFKTKKRA
ncbi:MAG: tRNA (adenosine(37)-N6)-threonylcarbamoyltransferase complex dimerization subunit type 1 TsaB [candidate division Zixibacteria bacterium RBG_16_40_9]|nr:MAG: tRNA (adenosine(37)-N6)-threonylcarbamoyltransferase complex dimerization subunit type 1 TsaB [candidate division Zixibacteria bacterium RBG_16_40_9]